MIRVDLTLNQYIDYLIALAEVWEPNEKDLAPWAMDLFIRCCNARGIEVANEN